MKNTIGFIIALILIIAGVWYFTQQSATAPSVETNTETMERESGEKMDEAGAIIEGDAMMEIDTSAAADVSGESMTEQAETMITDNGSSVREFTLDAFSFGYSLKEIVVNKGDTVRITLTNSDGFHDWVLDEFDAATEQIEAGQTDTIEFVADTVGTYEYYCSVGRHRQMGMVGTLIVQ